MRSILFFLLMILFMSCAKKRPEPLEVIYGVAFNSEREKVGLIQLDNDWVSFQKKESKDRIWWNSKDHQTKIQTSKAFYGVKAVQLRNDTLLYETDSFMIDGPITDDKFTTVEYTYSYVADTSLSQQDRWSYTISEQIGRHEGGKVRHCEAKWLTKHEADSILAAWDLKHP